jgi:hypothetical protein
VCCSCMFTAAFLHVYSCIPSDVLLTFAFVACTLSLVLACVVLILSCATGCAEPTPLPSLPDDHQPAGHGSERRSHRHRVWPVQCRWGYRGRRHGRGGWPVQGCARRQLGGDGGRGRQGGGRRAAAGTAHWRHRPQQRCRQGRYLGRPLCVWLFVLLVSFRPLSRPHSRCCTGLHCVSEFDAGWGKGVALLAVIDFGASFSCSCCLLYFWRRPGVAEGCHSRHVPLLSAHSAAVRCFPLAAQGPAQAAQSHLCIRTCPTYRGPSSSSCSTHLCLGTCSLHSDGATGRMSPPAGSCSRCWRRTGCPWGVCVFIAGDLCPVFVRAPVALCVRPCACGLCARAL